MNLILFCFIIAFIIWVVFFNKIKTHYSVYIIVGLILSILALWLSLVLHKTYIWYSYDNDKTATKGILFTDTIILSEHKLVGNANYVIFELDRYSRSDRQSEIINVVVNKNKGKK